MGIEVRQLVIRSEVRSGGGGNEAPAPQPAEWEALRASLLAQLQGELQAHLQRERRRARHDGLLQPGER